MHYPTFSNSSGKELSGESLASLTISCGFPCQLLNGAHRGTHATRRHGCSTYNSLRSACVLSTKVSAQRKFCTDNLFNVSVYVIPRLHLRFNRIDYVFVIHMLTLHVKIATA